MLNIALILLVDEKSEVYRWRGASTRLHNVKAIRGRKKRIQSEKGGKLLQITASRLRGNFPRLFQMSQSNVWPSWESTCRSPVCIPEECSESFQWSVTTSPEAFINRPHLTIPHLSFLNDHKRMKWSRNNGLWEVNTEFHFHLNLI